MELLQLVDVHVEEASRPLREEVANLKLLLAHITGSLECTSGEFIEQESSVVEEECSFGCFSPRARSCPSPHRDVSVAYESEDAGEFMAPVMEIMPELPESCGKPSPSLSMLHLQVDPLGTSTVASTPPPVESSYIGDKIMPELKELRGGSSVASMVELGSLESVAMVAMTSLPPASEEPDFVDTGGVLAPNSEALFGKELCDLLVSLEAANPGYGKEIACVLAGKASKGLIRKVEKSLRSRRKNRIITIKLPQLLASSYLASDGPDVVS
jgi:hypothetical protein